MYLIGIIKVYRICEVMSTVFFYERRDIVYSKFVQLLQERGLTAYKVSQETGISQSTLSDWKTGRASPKADKLLVLARYFGVPIEYFLTEKEET